MTVIFYGLDLRERMEPRTEMPFSVKPSIEQNDESLQARS